MPRKVRTQFAVEGIMLDPFEIMRRARAKVEEVYQPEDWEENYPEDPNDALGLLVNEAVLAIFETDGPFEIDNTEYGTRNLDQFDWEKEPPQVFL